MPNPVVHFELWSKDPQRISDFYGHVFNWKIQPVPELKYWAADTGGEGINGGIMRPQDGPWPGNMCIYIKVPRLADALARVTKAGGKPIVERMEIPNMGAFALFEDPDGRVIGLWE
jgi:predicted enzyme related to lactoylglutathione lyase